MATGFMLRHSIALLALFAGAAAWAADVALVGTFATKAAILSIAGGAPRTVKVGQTVGGVTLIAVENDRATIEVDGNRRVLQRGQTHSSGASGSSAQSITLAAGADGHFMADGLINGGPIRFLVDTGASAIAIPASDADRLRIDYRKGRLSTTRTAGGPITVYLVTLDSVRIGGIELRNIEAIVIEHGLPVALLGNSFLSRVNMRREGEAMTLIRRH
jgi:aspartyl protease family protein